MEFWIKYKFALTKILYFKIHDLKIHRTYLQKYHLSVHNLINVTTHGVLTYLTWKIDRSRTFYSFQYHKSNFSWLKQNCHCLFCSETTSSRSNNVKLGNTWGKNKLIGDENLFFPLVESPSIIVWHAACILWISPAEAPLLRKSYLSV